MTKNAAVQIVEKKNGKYVLDEDALKKILEQKSVMDKKVAIVAVAGAFRKGKSFFLSNCVRYLQDKNGWMAPQAVISGFEWKKSIESVTEGILMWPQPFIARDRNGEEYAILLMDTEGAFDHKSSMSQCANIFALSALLSSVLVYNVMQDIQEDTLNHLQFFASYGSFALDDRHAGAPFQSLLFLVRDWQNGDEIGMRAGCKLLDDIFKPHANSTDSMRALRKDIKRSFNDMKCFLLPSPGDKIRKGSEGNITVRDMEEDFQDGLRELIPDLFGTSLSKKEIDGNQITGAELFAFFKTYIKIFASGKLPEPRSIYDATSEATHQAASDISMEHYNSTMKKKFSTLSDAQFFEEAKLQTYHQDARNASIRIFEMARKMGSLPTFLYSLREKIESQFKEVFLKDNASRIKADRANKDRDDADRRRREADQQHQADMDRMRREMAEAQRKLEEAQKDKPQTFTVRGSQTDTKILDVNGKFYAGEKGVDVGASGSLFKTSEKGKGSLEVGKVGGNFGVTDKGVDVGVRGKAVWAEAESDNFKVGTGLNVDTGFQANANGMSASVAGLGFGVGSDGFEIKTPLFNIKWKS